MINDIKKYNGITELSIDERTSIYGGDEPAYALGYYARKAWDGIVSGWNYYVEKSMEARLTDMID